jgi:hypothetical protein
MDGLDFKARKKMVDAEHDLGESTENPFKTAEEFKSG